MEAGVHVFLCPLCLIVDPCQGSIFGENSTVCLSLKFSSVTVCMLGWCINIAPLTVEEVANVFITHVCRVRLVPLQVAAFYIRQHLGPCDIQLHAQSSPFR